MSGVSATVTPTADISGQGVHDMDDEATLEIVRQSALRMAKRQSSFVAAQADDIAMSVVEKYILASRERHIDDPAAWAASTAYWMSTDLAKQVKAQRDQEESSDSENAPEQIDVDPYSYPFRRVAGADSVKYALSCLTERERQLVELVDAGYSHAEIATIMGYSGARTVTTTLNRIRDKIDAHVGGEDERALLLEPALQALELRSELLGAPDDEEDSSDPDEPGPTPGFRPAF